MADFTVTNLFDAGAGSLRQAILDANTLPDADTIEFASSLSGGTIQLTSAELSISNPLTISGLGANALTIRGTGYQYDPSTSTGFSSRVFNILGQVGAGGTTTEVELNGLTITGGRPFINNRGTYYGNGGGILNTGANLTITNSIISGNTAVRGGGIHTNTISYSYSRVGRTTIIDSLISGNSAEGGGGVFNANIINSTITNNTASVGGGVAGRATITNSIISNNSAGLGGGIGELYFGPVSVRLIDSTVSGNSQGGGIFIYNAGLEVINSTISGNAEFGVTLQYFTDATLTNSTISGNAGNGVRIIEGSNADITNVTIANNAGIGLVSEFDFGVEVNLTNTIITNSGSGVDCSDPTPLKANVNNLIADGSCNPLLSGDPNLGPLQNNGGPTQTQALLPGSIAINAGSNAGIPPGITTDQRGFDRIFGPNVDIGVYEAVPEPLTLLGAATAAMFGTAFKRKLQALKRKKRDRT